jgi:two-component system, NarL family, sensor histidine kinase LiaS
LGGQLALSYALTTAIALILMEIVAIAGLFVAVNLFLPSFIGYGLQQQAIQLSPFFVHGAPDRQAIDRWAHLSNLPAGGTDAHGSMIVVDSQGSVITSAGKPAIPASIQLASQLSSSPSADLRRLLNGGTGDSVLVSHQSNGALVVMVPIRGTDGHVEGALVQLVSDLGAANRFWIGVYGIDIVLPSAIVLVVFAAIAGTIFGLMTARRLTRRLTRLSAALNGWSRGDFTRLVEDTSPDEIGELAGQLDQMAQRLRDLLDARQTLATLEERNRLARELHDSVKQQIFAVSMQLSTARALLGPAAGAANGPLAEAERLVDQAKGELTMLVRQLRPAALENREIVAALRQQIDEWSKQTGIRADAQLEAQVPLSVELEEALFRITQEGLSNVARHSGASAIRVRLDRQGEIVVLTIADDGHGFDTARVNGHGVGLPSMRERAQALGGQLTVESVAGQGTTVTASCRL